MEDLFGINAHRQAVQENIEKAFDLGFDADNNIEGIEKAKHQVGDIHPNGRWVWTEWAPGKFDWKSLKGKHHKGSQQTTTQQQTTEVKIDNNEYKKQYDIVLKQLMSGSDENKSAFNFGLNIVRGNISNAKKELKELKETRPGAKKAIQKLESDLVKFYSQEKAFNDALKDAKTLTEDKVEENKKDDNKKKSKVVKLTKKDKEEIEEKINKFKYKGSDGWTLDRNRLPYDFELGDLKDGSITLYGSGKAYGDSKTVKDEFTYNKGKEYTMWFRGIPSNYFYAEPKQQLANEVISLLKNKRVLNEENYKSFKVKMSIYLD